MTPETLQDFVDFIIASSIKIWTEFEANAPYDQRADMVRDQKLAELKLTAATELGGFIHG